MLRHWDPGILIVDKHIKWFGIIEVGFQCQLLS
ncbi:MAG: hypothetical protein ACEY3K_11595 [Wolbachia sp.]